MTRIFNDKGVSTPVSVIEVDPNHITQIKNAESDGYCAVQVTTGQKKASKVSKALAGHFSKANVEPGRGLWEFRVTEDELKELQAGQALTVDMFEVGQKIDVQGITKGRGFSGVIRRHNFSSQRMSHGNSLAHRAPGSIGQNQTPGRVFKGKKMAGQMGNEQRTIYNLEVVRIDADKNLLLV